MNIKCERGTRKNFSLSEAGPVGAQHDAPA